MEDTGLENELLNTETEALPSEEVRTYSFYAGDEKIDGSSGAGYLDNQEGLIENATEDDLRGYWDSAENLQDQFGGDWDKYMSYMNERQDLIDSGEYEVGDYGQIVETSAVQNVDGTMIEPADMQNLSKNDFIAKYGLDPSEVQLVETDTTGARAQGFTDWSNSDAVVALNEKYGIDSTRVTEEGREYQWNGSAYVKTKDYDNFDFGSLAKLVVKATASALVTPALGGALTSALTNAGLSSSLASAASSAILNSATQLVTTGELDVGQALLSAAGTYFQQTGVGGLLGDTQVGQAITDATTFVQEKVSAFQDLISTGSSIADAAIQSGGISMLTSFVSSGEVNLESALASAIQGGVQAGYQELVTASGITSEDEFEAFMSEQDELQQAFIDADVKDPFLNPNYVTIGDGLMQNTAGEVFNYNGDSVGNMSDLDVDGDGVLNANDLEFVEATGTYRPTGTFSSGVDAIEDGKAYYLADDGNVYAVSDYDYAGDGTYKHKETGHVISGIEEGVAVNGQLMVDTNGDGQFNEVWNNKGQRVGVFDPETKQWLNLDGEVSNKIGTYMNEINNVGGGQEYDNPFEYTREEYSLLSGADLMDDMFTNRGSGGMTSMTKVELAAIMQKFDSVEAFEAYAQEQGFGINISGDQVVISTGVDYDGIDGNDGVWNITDGSSVDDIFGGPKDPSGTNVNVTDGPNQPTTENPFEEEVEVDEETSDVSDPVDNEEDALTGGPSGAGDNGGANENDYTEDTNVNDSTVVDVTNPLTDSATENQEETEVTDTGDVVDSNGEVATNTGDVEPNGGATTVSGQNGDTTSTGTGDDTTTDGSGDVTDETTIGDGTTGDGGTDSTATGPGDDTTGTGDPGIDDGTGGTGGGGDGGGGGDKGEGSPQWSDLFRYTTIQKPALSKYAPTIGKVRSMFNDIS